jgi:hypothetical protein
LNSVSAAEDRIDDIIDRDRHWRVAFFCAPGNSTFIREELSRAKTDHYHPFSGPKKSPWRNFTGKQDFYQQSLFYKTSSSCIIAEVIIRDKYVCGYSPSHETTTTPNQHIHLLQP